jgi:hypothetical protein
VTDGLYLGGAALIVALLTVWLVRRARPRSRFRVS